MTNKQNLVVFLVSIWLAGCNDVQFKQPQPSGAETLTTIPETYHGVYLLKGGEFLREEVTGESWMRITDSMVYQYAWEEKLVPYLEGSDYDSLNIPEIGDQVQSMIRGEFIDMIYIGDGFASYTESNLLEIAVGDSLVIKEAEGSFFLNLREEKQGMMIWRLVLTEQMRNGDLLLWTDEDYEESRAEEYFEIEQVRNQGYGSSFPLADPSKEQLMNFIAAGGYRSLVHWWSRDFDRYTVPPELWK